MSSQSKRIYKYILYIHITSNLFFADTTIFEEKESQLGLYAYVKFMFSSVKCVFIWSVCVDFCQNLA